MGPKTWYMLGKHCRRVATQHWNGTAAPPWSTRCILRSTSVSSRSTAVTPFPASHMLRSRHRVHIGSSLLSFQSSVTKFIKKRMVLTDHPSLPQVLESGKFKGIQMTSDRSFVTGWKGKGKVSLRGDESHAVHEAGCGVCVCVCMEGCGWVVFADSRGVAGMEARGLRCPTLLIHTLFP